MQFCTRFRLSPGVWYRNRLCLVCLSCGRAVGRTISSWSLETFQRAEKTSWEVQPGVKFQRTYSSIPADSAPYAVIHAAEVFFQTVHHYTHLPWCGVIILTTIVLRSLVTLPLAIHQNNVITKMELLMPTLKEYQEAVKHNVVTKCRREDVPYKEAKRRVNKECRKVTRELYRQEGCHPYKVAFLPWVQLPLWFVLSFALRNMTGVFPGLSPPEDVLTSLATEGMLWFPDLTAPDPYCILPILLATTNLMNIELHALRRKSPTRAQRMMTYTFRFLSVGMGYIGSQMPAAMTLYWSMSSSYGLMQNIALKLPKVRRKLGIPRTPSESKHPFRDLAEIVEEKSRTFIRLQEKDTRRK